VCPHHHIHWFVPGITLTPYAHSRCIITEECHRDDDIDAVSCLQCHYNHHAHDAARPRSILTITFLPAVPSTMLSSCMACSPSPSPSLSPTCSLIPCSVRSSSPPCSHHAKQHALVMPGALKLISGYPQHSKRAQNRPINLTQSRLFKFWLPVASRGNERDTYALRLCCLQHSLHLMRCRCPMRWPSVG